MTVLQNTDTNLMLFFSDAKYSEVINIVFDKQCNLYLKESSINLDKIVLDFPSAKIAMEHWTNLLNLLKRTSSTSIDKA